MGMYAHEASAMMGGMGPRSVAATADARTLTERMESLAQTAQSALDRLTEVQARVTGIRMDAPKGDRLNSVPTPTPALPHSMERAEGALSAIHDTLAAIERVL